MRGICEGMSPTIEHNHKLSQAYIKANGSPPRYSPVRSQVELLPLDQSKLPKGAYNPSIGKDVTGRLWMTYRYHPKPDFRTAIGIATIRNAGELSCVQDLLTGENSYEDARMFSFRGEPWMSWVEAKNDGGKFKSVLKYAQMDCPHNDKADLRRWQTGRVYQVNAGGNDWSSIQKNWCFFESDENLFCVFASCSGTGEQVVFQVHGDKVVNEYRTPGVRWPYGQIRGGNAVLRGGKLLRVFHSSTGTGIGFPEKRYYVGILTMEPKPPFTVFSVGRRPVIYASELPKSDVHHFKPNIAFPTGLMVDGENIIIALGVNDAACAFARIYPNQFQL